MTHRLQTLLFVAVIVLAAACWAAANSGIEPDAVIQAQIAAAAAAKNEAELQGALSKLRGSGGNEYERLIPQLVYTLMQAKDDRLAMAPGVIIQRLSISTEQLRAALQPYRDTSDPKLRMQIDNLLAASDETRPTK